MAMKAEDLLKRIASVIAPTLKRIASFAVSASKKTAGAIVPALVKIANVLVPALKKIAGAIVTALVKIANVIIPALKKIAGAVKPWLEKCVHAVTPKRILVTASLLMGILCVTLVYVLLVSEAPPLTAFEKARHAISQARHAEAAIYAPDLLQEAELSWERALTNWEQESQKWRHQRRFRAATIATIKTTRLADSAAAVAMVHKDSLQWLAATGISLVKARIETLRTQFETLPMQSQLRIRFMMGELAIIESELAFQREDFVQAVARYQHAAEHVGSAGDEAMKTLHAYLGDIPKWQKWATETIDWSKQQQDVAIIVDKIAARSKIYKAGELVVEFPIELGPYWVGHKKVRGDNATPEGRYYITKRKERERTKYYKALEINYPNEEDKQRFQAAQARGELPRNAHIGGLIEIHGDGGKGVNWTAGCVALRNDHMDEVYKLAKVGTPVTIVGSLKGLPALEETFQNLRKQHMNGHTQH